MPTRHIPTPRSEALAQPLRVALYARTSHDPKKRATSTEDQLCEGRAECADRGWTVVDEFIDDDLSASAKARKTRDDFEALVALVESGGCDVIWAWETSRLLRTLETYLQLRALCQKHGVLWCIGDTLYDLSKRSDRRATALDAVAAEDEAFGIQLRVARTVRLNAKRGRPHGRILFGYRRTYDPDTGDLIGQVPHPEQAPVVREVFAQLAAGKSAYSIAKALDKRGLRPSPEARWDGARMIEIARNPAYIGKLVHQGEIIGDAVWDGLVDAATWHAVQKLLADPGRATMPDTIVRHLLSGIARCGVCDCHCPMRVYKPRGRLTYTCDKCFCTAIAERSLDAYVEEALIGWLSSETAVEILRSAPDDAAFTAALAEVAALEAQLADARQAAAHPDPARRLSVASLIALEAGLNPQITEGKRRIERLAPRLLVPEVDGLLGQADVDARWADLVMEQRRVVLRAVADVRLYKGVRGSRKIQPGRVKIVFGPQPRQEGTGRGRRPW